MELTEPRAPVEQAEILGADDRRVVTDPTGIPFRFICCVDFFHRLPGGGEPLPRRGTGTLISPRHVLTAAHNVLDDLTAFGLGPGRTRPTWAFAAPGRHLQRLPFGRSAVVKSRVSPQWEATDDDQFDFALLTLKNDLGSVAHQVLGGRPLAFWGDPRHGAGTRIRPVEPARLRRQALNISGYPSDKCGERPPDRALTLAEVAACWTPVAGQLTPQGSTQWRSFGRVVDPSPADLPRTIAYDLDAAVGHSGSPVWLRWSGYRNLIAVNTTGLPGPPPGFPIVASLGVRLTEGVLGTLRDWIRADGVTPSF